MCRYLYSTDARLKLIYSLFHGYFIKKICLYDDRQKGFIIFAYLFDTMPRITSKTHIRFMLKQNRM